MPITPDDIAGFTDRDEYGGWGYLGHSERTVESDRMIAVAATDLELDLDDLFRWANSTYARHTTDNPPSTIVRWAMAINADLAALQAPRRRR